MLRIRHLNSKSDAMFLCATIENWWRQLCVRWGESWISDRRDKMCLLRGDWWLPVLRSRNTSLLKSTRESTWYLRQEPNLAENWNHRWRVEAAWQRRLRRWRWTIDDFIKSLFSFQISLIWTCRVGTGKLGVTPQYFQHLKGWGGDKKQSTMH